MKSPKLISWLILLFLVLVWGTSFILIKKGLEVFSSAQLGSIRILLAALTLLPFGIRGIKKVTKKEWKYLILAGLLGNGFPAYLYAIAQHGIDSSVAGVLNSLTTLFTLIVAVTIFRVKTKWFNVTGVFIGLVGAVGLISISGGGNFEFNMKYASFIIMATICYAFNVNIVKTFLGDMKPVKITAFALLSLAFPVAIILFGFTDFLQVAKTNPRFPEGMGYLVILSVIGTALALVLFNKLIQLTSSIFAASVTYMIPLVAVFWGIWDGEPFNLIYVLWIGLILTGVYLVNMKKILLLRKGH